VLGAWLVAPDLFAVLEAPKRVEEDMAGLFNANTPPVLPEPEGGGPAGVVEGCPNESGGLLAVGVKDPAEPA
jgi:hypothetical protein